MGELVHFGNFLRTRVEHIAGGIAPFARTCGLEAGSIERWCRAATFDELKVNFSNTANLLRGLQLSSVDELNSAWQNADLPPFPKRRATPFARKVNLPYLTEAEQDRLSAATSREELAGILEALAAAIRSESTRFPKRQPTRR